MTVLLFFVFPASYCRAILCFEYKGISCRRQEKPSRFFLLAIRTWLPYHGKRKVALRAAVRRQAPSLLRGKATAIVVTGGFDPQKIVVPFEMAMKVFALRHKIDYLGWEGGTDPGKGRVFMNVKKEQRMRAFARTLLEKLEDRSKAAGTAE